MTVKTGGRPNSRWQTWVGWLACVLLVIPALLRVCVHFNPNPYFDMDPRMSGSLPSGLGPAGSLLLDLLSLLGCTLALLASSGNVHQSARRLLWLIIPIFLAIPALIHHSRSDLGDLWIGSAWLAAACTGVGAAVLGRHLNYRIVLIASVMALAAPLTAKAVYQVAVEHQISVEEFAANREQILRAQGWRDDSVQARLYVRRLEQREASGWQPLSNVFGSIAAMLATFWVAAALTAARSKLSSGWIGVIALAAMASLTTLALTFSRGAIGAGVIGIVLAGLVLLPKRWRRIVRPWTFTLTLALIGLAVVVTVLRGSLLGESFKLDGYSLLFRWHYWQAGVRTLWEHLWAGAGPNGFKNAYVLFKPALSPEEVSDPHQVYLSWLATMGLVGGMSFAVLSTWVFLRQAAPSWISPTGKHEAADASGEHAHEQRRADWIVPLVICLVVMVASAWIAGSTMLPDFRWVFWPIAWTAAFILMYILPALGSAGSWTSLRWGAWAALTVVFLHCQIEMTMSQPGVAALIWLVLGASSAEVIAPGSVTEEIPVDRWVRPLRYTAVTLMTLVCVAQAVCAWWPVRAEQKVVRQAATLLVTVGQVQEAIGRARQPGMDAAQQVASIQRAATRLSDAGFDPHIEGLLRQTEAAIRSRDGDRFAHVMIESSDSVGRALVQLDLDRIGQAIALLEQADQMLPIDSVPLRTMTKLWVTLAQFELQASDLDAARHSMAVAGTLVERELQRRPDHAEVHAFAAATVYLFRYDNGLGSKDDLTRAVEEQRTACRLDPHGLTLSLGLAELLYRSGDNDAALSEYRRTLLLNDQVRLDPMKQLTGQQWQHVKDRIAELASRSG